MKNPTKKRHIIIVLLAIVLMMLPVSGEEKTRNFRDRTEYISFSLSGSLMGFGIAISSPTLKWKYIFWEIVNTEVVVSTGNIVAGVALYTKTGYHHYFTSKSELQTAIGFGGGYFLGSIPEITSKYDDQNCNYSPGVCQYYGFYIQPEASYVHNFNEKYALQIGVQFPLIFPRFFPYPYKLFIGFRY